MSSSYRFVNIHIDKAPSFFSQTFPPIEALGEHLNILHGPNGVGKTTLVRTLRSLIAKTEFQNDYEAEASVQDGEDLWHLSLSRGKLKQKRLRDNAELLLPGINEEFADAYSLALHELLSQQEGVGSSFLEEIQKQMQGGVDFQKAAELSKAQATFSTAGIQLAKDVRKYRTIVLEKQKEVARLIEREQALAGKQAAIDERKLQLKAEEQLRLLFSCKQAQETLHTLEQNRQVFDPRLASIDQFALKRAHTLGDEAKSASDSLKQELDELASVEKELYELAVSKEQLADKTLTQRLAAGLDALSDAQQRLSAAKTQVTEKLSELRKWEEQYKWLIDRMPENQTLKEKLQTLGQMAREVEKLRCTLASAQQVARELGEEEAYDPTRLEHLRSLKSELVRLLSIYEQQRSREGRSFLVIALAISLVSLLLSLLVHPLFGLATTATLVFLLLKKRGPAGLSEQAEKLLHQLGYPVGEHTDPKALAELTATVLQELATLERVAESNRMRREAKRSRTEAEQAYQAWRDEWKEASKALYLSDSPALESAPFFLVADHLKDWNDAMVSHYGACAVYDEAGELYDAACQNLKSMCNVEMEDADTLIAYAKTLHKNIESSHKLLRDREKMLERIAELRKQSAEKAEKYEQFFKDLELAVDDFATLERWVSILPQYQDLQAKLKLVTIQLAEFPEELRTEAEETSLGEITDQLHRFGALKEELDEWVKALAGDTALIAAAKHDTQLENAALDFARTLSELDTRREEEVQACMVHLLLSKVQAQTERSFRPEVLKRSSDWLARITAQRYTLSVGPKGFAALDTKLQQSFSLDELSSGTKVQLLFAVRMAFLEMQEASSGYRFPVFFDEVMGNSDDERSLAIAQAIAEISRDRQVFYCTAQADEVEKLTRAAGDLVHTIDLEDAKRGYTLERHPFVMTKTNQQSLPPFSEDYSEYARLCKVAGPDLYEPIGALSSWYVCTTSKELEALLKRGLSTCGQARQLDERYEMRVDLLKYVQTRVRIGRPKILRVADLADENLKLNRNAGFYEGLLSFVGEAERSGSDILRAIEERTLKGVSKSAREALETFFTKEGFATEEKRIPFDQILTELSLKHPELQVDSEEYLICVRYLECLGFEN